MTKKKVVRNFGDRKSGNLSGKGQICKIFHRVLKFFENSGGNRKEGGETHHGIRGGWTPLSIAIAIPPLWNNLPPVLGQIAYPSYELTKNLTSCYLGIRIKLRNTTDTICFQTLLMRLFID